MRPYYVIAFLLFMLFPYSSKGQQNAFYAKYNQTPLDTVLLQIKDHFNVQFAYDNDFVNQYKVTLFLEGATLEETLKRTLEFTQLSYKKVDNNVILLIPFRNMNKNMYKLTGRVLNYSTLQGIENVHVSIKDQNSIAVTNKDGYFSAYVADTMAVLKFSHVSFEPVALGATGFCSRSVPVYMFEKAVVLNDVPVNEIGLKYKSLQDGHKKELDMYMYSKMIGANGPDALKGLRILPSVSSIDEVTPGLVIRGGSPWQNSVCFDGITMYNSDHLLGIQSAFGIYNTEKVNLDVYSADAEEGGNVGASIVIEGKTSQKEKVNANALLGLNDAALGIGIPFARKLSLYVSARQSYAGVNPPLFNTIIQMLQKDRLSHDNTYNDAESLTFKPYIIYYDLYGKLNYQINDNHTLSFTMLNNTEQHKSTGSIVTSTFEYGMREENYWKNRGLSLQYKGALFHNLRLYMDASFSKHQQVFNQQIVTLFDDNAAVNDEYKKYYQRDDIRNLQVKGGFHYDYLPQHTLSAGVEIEDLIMENEINNTVSQDFNLNKGTLKSIYIKNKSQFGGLLINPGLRVAKWTGFGYLFEPRLQSSYAFKNGITLKADYSVNRQFVNRVFINDISNSSKSFWVMSNQQELPITGQHINAGVFWSNFGWTIGAEGYKRNVRQSTIFYGKNNSDYLQLDSIDFASETVTVNKSEVDVKGAEFSVSKQTKNWSLFTSYTYAKNLTINDKKPHPSNQDIPSEFKLFTDYKILNNWGVSLNWAYASGRPYTKYFLDEKGQITNSGINNYRLPHYHRLDLSSKYEWGGKWYHASIIMSVINAYNHKNVKYRYYKTLNISSDAGKKEKILIPVDIYLLGITPSVTLQVQF